MFLFFLNILKLPSQENVEKRNAERAAAKDTSNVAADSLALTMQYRDRAKERREKHRGDASPGRSRRMRTRDDYVNNTTAAAAAVPPVLAEQPTAGLLLLLLLLLLTMMHTHTLLEYYYYY